jgi:kynurenine formamidase
MVKHGLRSASTRTDVGWCDRAALVALHAAWLLVAACRGGPAPAPASPPFPGGTLVDLSHPYDAQTIFWPTAPRFELRKEADGITPGGFYYAANSFSTAEHGGTHIDAPAHFAQGRQTVDQIPLEQLIGSAVVIDVVEQSERDADYRVLVEDLRRFEQQHGAIPPRAIVLFRTGYSRYWPDAARYLGTAERGEAAVAKLHFPGLHPTAARWLVENRDIAAVGIDTASIDYGQSTTFETHRILNERNIPALENLASLERLPPTGARIIALPMKIAGGSGAPLRAVAVLP